VRLLVHTRPEEVTQSAKLLAEANVLLLLLLVRSIHTKQGHAAPRNLTPRPLPGQRVRNEAWLLVAS
jgi:hypothetical protein